MIAIAYYLLKVFICSIILFGYYHLALRNKLFHQWNRYYLLLTICCSLLIPCFEFPLFIKSVSAQPIQLLQVVYTADEFVAGASAKNQFSFSWEQTSYTAYTCITVMLLFSFLLSIYKIYRLIRSHTVQIVNSIKFINTEVKGTPFSFLNYIFWNRNINIHTETGQQIFQHELVHVQEKHSLDKLFVQLILALFWWNPVYWLIRNELKMIHEFIADKKAVGQSDTSAFAAMILQTAYPQHSFNNLGNQFFQSSIKRRLTMLTKQNNSKLSYVSRIVALPLIAFLAFAFTIKTQTSSTGSAIALDREITVVIDAGHGENSGAAFEHTYEDDLVLALAKTIKEINVNDKINIVFTRENDAKLDLNERVKIAERHKADLFISLHMNEFNVKPETPDSNGIVVFVSNKQTPYLKESVRLASALVDELSNGYPKAKYAALGKANAYVVSENVCPAVLVACGYITDAKDRNFMSQSSSQKLFARQILTAIERFAASGNTSHIKPVQTDTVPGLTVEGVPIPKINIDKKEINQNPLIYIDGVKKGRLKELGGLDKLVSANDIKSMNVYKGTEAIKKYGSSGKDGVIELMTKNAVPPPPPAAPAPAKETTTNPSDEVTIQSSGEGNPLVFIDGKESGRMKDGKLNDLRPDEIESIEILKGETAKRKYGSKGEDGTIEIITKKVKSAPIEQPKKPVQIEEIGLPLLEIEKKTKN